MTQCPAARIGDTLDDIDTPALVVDLDALESNIEHMAAFTAANGIRLRPHAKTHKCSAVARLQIAAGAVGICCQKVSEAEAMANAGITDILVSNEVVGSRKLERLAALSKRVTVAVCADNAENVDAIDAAAAEYDTTLTVLVEVDVGGGRCGVRPGEEARDLALHIAAAPNLRFGGIQAYHGPAQHVRDHAERGQKIAAATEALRASLDLLTAEGLECDIIGGAGTGSYVFETSSGLWNELQVGSYVFMDHDYALNFGETGGPVDTFRHSLTIRTTVMSAPTPTMVATDAGLKAYTTDCGLPALVNLPEGKVFKAADEHTMISFETPEARPAMGAVLSLIPGHCDPTVNLHDWIVGVRNGRVECLWPVDARGAVF
ncbi:DSD1 family PLP-dependent enzyme [Tropicimonas sp. IMCC6043]|uniref:DSD1 family PLP-dependent enzyme n=1 Tax=Tropicimonas sp. IMCC6043 TaxID=2510645 RepID=UPI00101D1260|nr:DSD1 family PLP-dependent enzyme [Tropicimonas sp. IMCC6043]RYH07538.1 DSD1 family PLP-dependent enzyme [Tropicimonas sp. IMCC6043]